MGDRSCFNCGEEGHNKRDCPTLPKKKCFNCGEEGHSKTDCPQPPMGRPCYNCGMEGHSKQDCTQPRQHSGACFNCGEEGHSKADCPNPRKMGACHNCGEEGHSKADCPQPRKPFGPCFNCGEEGHSKSECQQPRKTGPCFNCGEEGHSKVDCPNPKVFKGTCRICQKEGHPASECPDKPPPFCKNCQEEGHYASECTKTRVFDKDDSLPEDPESLWQMMIDADKVADFDEFKKALLAYSKLCPDTTLREYEEIFRSEGFKIHLIAMEKEIYGTQTIINLQGVEDLKYVVTLQNGPNPRRRALVGNMIAASREQNLARLEQAGFIHDSFKLYCTNCKQRGHNFRTCTEEKAQREETTLVERPARENPVQGPWSIISNDKVDEVTNAIEDLEF